MRLLRLTSVVAFLGMLCVAAPTSAAPIFLDNFNAENGGVGVLNFDSFTNWAVSDGTVDLIGNGFFEFFGGAYGLYVDMDGSTGNAGKLTTRSSFVFENGVQYTLSFDLAGNQRGYPSDSVNVQVSLGGLVNSTITLPSAASFATYTYNFVGNGTSGAVSFEGLGGDNVGALLDNVALTAVPEPSSLMLVGLGLLVVARRARR